MFVSTVYFLWLIRPATVFDNVKYRRHFAPTNPTPHQRRKTYRLDIIVIVLKKNNYAWQEMFWGQLADYWFMHSKNNWHRIQERRRDAASGL